MSDKLKVREGGKGKQDEMTVFCIAILLSAYLPAWLPQCFYTSSFKQRWD